MVSETAPRGVHLTGSVLLADAEEVFRTVSSVLGNRVKRVPDGETGERSGWIAWLLPIFAEHPLLELAPADDGLEPGTYGTRPSYRIRPGVNPSD